MGGLALARMLRRRKTATGTHIGIPGAGSAAKAKKAPAKKKKAPAKKKAAAKRPVTIRPPKAPLPKRSTATGKGVAQKVTPSAQVMSNLAGYVNAPGGRRAGVGTAGRTSMSSTGRTAGSRVGGAGARSSIRAPSAARMRTHG
jgi:hypothetical protein